MTNANTWAALNLRIIAKCNAENLDGLDRLIFSYVASSQRSFDSIVLMFGGWPQMADVALAMKRLMDRGLLFQMVTGPYYTVAV